jgi:hypothetical protein
MGRFEGFYPDDIDRICYKGLPYFEKICSDDVFRNDGFKRLDILCQCSSNKRAILLECKSLENYS